MASHLGGGMKIIIDGVVVCSLCGDVWKSYRGISGDEPVQCASCGARPQDEDFPYDGESGDYNEATA